jgi:hypothetical protein
MILVDGKGYRGDGRYHVYKDVPDSHVARLRDVQMCAGWASATSECAAMYEPELGVRRADRTIVFTPKGRLVLLDLLAADQPREWTYLLHSDWPAERLSSDAWRLWSGAGEALFRLLTPEDVTIDQLDTEIEANPTASTPSLRITKTLRTLRIRTPRRERTRFLTVIDPSSAASVLLEREDGWAVRLGADESVELVEFDTEGRWLR